MGYQIQENKWFSWIVMEWCLFDYLFWRILEDEANELCYGLGTSRCCSVQIIENQMEDFTWNAESHANILR